MSLRFYNTLSGKKEEFAPLEDNLVRMYTCGPTVYNYAHIGNLRAYVFADTLRRALEYAGFKVRHIINITDVGHLTSDTDEGEDKMLKALKRESKPFTLEAMREVADAYTRAFVDDLKALNIQMPAEMPRASDHIREDIELIRELEKKGFTYQTKSGIYFDTSKFPAYGKLGNINLKGLLAGARVEVNPEKRNLIDFTLWKLAKSGLPAFESPWGPGFPGWHIECSAMSRKYLGQPFDIHTGGIDHIPTHHQNEIAQSEAAYGVPLARFWMHNEHLIVPDGKMAKSGENFITLRTLKDRGIHPLSYRYFLLQSHYRSPVNFSWEALHAAQNAYFHYLRQFASLPDESMISSPLRTEIRYRINDDLNTPRVLSFLRSEFEQFAGSWSKNTVNDIDKILGLDIEKQSKKLAEEMAAVPKEMTEKAARRDAARREKNFTEADSLRAEIEHAGFEIMDTDSVSLIRKHLF